MVCVPTAAAGLAKLSSKTTSTHYYLEKVCALFLSDAKLEAGCDCKQDMEEGGSVSILG